MAQEQKFDYSDLPDNFDYSELPDKEFKNKTIPKSKFTTGGIVSDLYDPNKEREDRGLFRIGKPGDVDRFADSFQRGMTDRIATSNFLPEFIKPGLASLSSAMITEPARFGANLIANPYPEDILAPSLVRGSIPKLGRKATRGIEAVDNQVAQVPQQRALPAGQYELPSNMEPEFVPSRRAGRGETLVSGTSPRHPNKRTNVGEPGPIEQPNVFREQAPPIKEGEVLNAAELEDLDLVQSKGVLTLDDLGNDPVKIRDYAKLLREETGSVALTGKGLPPKPKVTFLGMQQQLPGEPDIKLYNVEIGPGRVTTVTEDSLKKLGLEAPPDDVQLRLNKEGIAPIPETVPKAELGIGSPDEVSDLRLDELRNQFAGMRTNRTPAAIDFSEGIQDSLLGRLGGRLKSETGAVGPDINKAAIDKIKADPKLSIAEKHKQIKKILEPERAQELPIVDKRMSNIEEAYNLPRGIMASLDFSAPFRQGLGLIHKKQFWTGLPDMLKAAKSESYFDDVQKAIAAKPTFKLAERSGLSLTDLTKLRNREEQIMSTWAEKIPGIRGSNRAYVAFLNKLRMDVFDDLVKKAETINKKPISDMDARGLAEFINTATGRGSLGPKFEQAMPVLRNLFFSPRLMASRIQAFNPYHYYKLPPMARKEALKSLLAVAAAGNSVAALGSFMGADVEQDPASADFMKVKVGNTRLDPWGGHQQYLSLIHRMLPEIAGALVPDLVKSVLPEGLTDTGRFKSTRSGQDYQLGDAGFGEDTRFDLAGDFLSNKLNPVASFVTDWMRQNQRRPFIIENEVVQRMTPIIAQDFIEIFREDPSLLWMIVPSAVGMGSQTFDSGKEESFITGNESIFGEVLR